MPLKVSVTDPFLYEISKKKKKEKYSHTKETVVPNILYLLFNQINYITFVI